WTKPTGWVHCFFVEVSYAAASCAALWPVSEDLNGCLSLHHTSLARPSAPWPRASTADGKRIALAIVAILGFRPCWAAWRRKLAKSGGMATPLMTSTPADLNFEIALEKSSLPSLKRPPSTIV